VGTLERSNVKTSQKEEAVATINRFEEIEAWQTARQLSRVVYSLTKQGSFAHDFGLRDQIRRAAVSIMSNIAEGFESRTQPLFVELLGRAKGSAGELRCQAYVALDVEYIGQSQFQQLFDLAEKCSRQISRFISYLLTHPDNQRFLEDRVEYGSETFLG
jgi:four helix bundle protein